jgi:hypothetical protein
MQFIWNKIGYRWQCKRIKIKNEPFITTLQRLLACACLKPAGFVLAAPLHLALIWGPLLQISPAKAWERSRCCDWD